MRYESKYEKYYGIDPFNPANTLKQHGILGMKWGVWNEETKARYLGGNGRKNKGDGSKYEQVGSKVSVKEEKKTNSLARTLKIQRDNFNDSFETEVRPVTKKELKEIGLQDLIKAFNINSNDLVIAVNPKHKWMPEIYNKDGTSFRITTEFSNGEVLKEEYSNLYDFYINADWETHLNRTKIDHSDTSSDSYYAIDPSTAVEHEGVKGMKWGVWNEETRARRLRERRRASKAGESSVIGSKNNLFNKLTNAFSKNTSDEQPHLKRTHLSKELANISDEELNAAIKRMQLEQTYLNMLKNYPNSSDKGKKYVDQFSDELFKNLSNGLGGAMGKRIAKAIDDLVNGDSNNDKKYDNEVRSKSNDEIKAYNERKKLEEAYKGYRQKEDKK